MKKIYVTFGGVSYDATLKRIAEDGPKFGADEVWIYDEPFLMGTRFYREHQYMWEHPGYRGTKIGFGWYCFKPAVILHAMSHLHKGDILLWSDGDTFPISDFSMLYDACVREAGFFCFEACGCSDRRWVKRDVWEAVFGPHEVNHYNLDSQHATARFMLFEKGKAAVKTFLEEWEQLCVTKWLATRDPSVTGPEFLGFEENRGDQSIFSLLTHRYGIPLHREADAFGENSQKDRDLYPQLFTQIYCQGNRADLSGSAYRRGPGI